jgi:membrane-associated protease RseP (regulator of RpoE activity)
MISTDSEQFNRAVARVMDVEDITMGDPKQNFLVRYRGRLRGDSQTAYDTLAADLRPQEITPLFRNEKGNQVILLMPGVINPKPSNPVVNLVMFALTVFSMFLVGAAYVYEGPANSFGELFLGSLATLWKGWPFALTLLAILVCHEFGHYLAGRYHKTYVTLPYFIPMPVPGSFGTMGAFIQLKEPPKNRRILLDIGLAGPLAGLVVAIPLLFLGLSLSTVSPIHLGAGEGIQLEGNSLLYLFSKFVVFGKLLPAPLSYGNLPPFLYWVRFFFTGKPLPIGGLDVMLSPVAWAAWAGLLVTALNLIPAGQLDGGHLMYVLAGRRAQLLLPFILGALILLGTVWVGWWLWAFIIFLLGRVYAEPLDQITPLDPRRRALAVLGLVVFVLVFMPVPLIQAFGGA